MIGVEITSRGRLLGIDHGNKRIGLAICDANWTAARPLEILVRKDRTTDFARINSILTKQHIAAIVIGLPELPEQNPDHPVTDQSHTVRRWASRLAAAVSLPVYLWDERYSTFEAEELAAETGRRGNGPLDDYAAAVILQSFIDEHPAGTPNPAPIK
ncbi:MAG: Holliday junction resolvase RuvX [Chloroflexota bacterium]